MLNVLAEATDRFLEARNLSNLENISEDIRDTDKVTTDSQKKALPNFFLCNRPGYRAQECSHSLIEPARCATFGRHGYKTTLRTWVE